jgi:hypothetical protein
MYRRFLYEGSEIIARITLHEPAGKLPDVREEVVQDIWYRQEFAMGSLTSTAGENVVIVEPGRLNTDAGPDFLEAQIELDDLLWVGAVEIHRTSGGWYEHGHDRDPKYNRVILHVSLQADEQTGSLKRADGSVIPEVILYPYLRTSVRKLLYRFYRRSQEDIYCRSFWDDVPDAIQRRWIRWLGLERLHAHRQRLGDEYLETPDLTRLLYRHVFRALGYAKNAGPMEMLADRVTFDLAQCYVGELERLEALFFGMAGFLSQEMTATVFDSNSPTYVDRLREYFSEMSENLKSPPMDPSAWQFFRLRPANFPTLRIAQGVALLRSGRLLDGDAMGRLVEAVTAEKPVRELRALLQVPLPEFWTNHIRLDRPTKPRDPRLGNQRANDVAVNVLLPMLLLYAEQRDRPGLSERVEAVLDEFPSGSDRITRKYAEMGTRSSSALEAQGMHQLYRTRCSEARCLQCAIGRYVLHQL